jgi:hypothetical protein
MNDKLASQLLAFGAATQAAKEALESPLFHDLRLQLFGGDRFGLT